MAVQFILGRSGTGKTTYCLDAIVAALTESSEKRLILLVPEQATYQAERAILSDPKIKGYNRLQILSFNRLQFFLTGKASVARRISPIGRQMLAHKVLRESREELQVFAASSLVPGFAREIANTIAELHRYAQTPEELDALQGRFPSEVENRLATLKFADLALIFRRYAESLQGRFVDPDAQVIDACAKVAQADFLKGARLWVDGFASFTGGELALLAELFAVVERSHIALCIDPAAPNEGLFEPTQRTYADLRALVAEAKIGLTDPIVLTEARRFTACPSLAHVEANIFRAEAKPAKAGRSIRVVAEADPRGEVQFVAGQVRSLVQDKGYRYRDIAVVASDLGRYEPYVRAYFNDYDIPFFIDKRRPLNQHPVIELLTSALQIVTGGFAHADVFAYLKTDLTPIPSADVERLENYCLAFGVDGRDWIARDPWQFKAETDKAFDESKVNRIRDRVTQPLLDLKRSLLRDGDPETTLTTSDFTRAVFAFLDELDVYPTAGRWVQQAHEAGDLGAVDSHRQFFEKFVEIFDELTAVFEDQAMTARDIMAILTPAFAQMTMAFIPPSLDQVLVGSIERSRHPNLKAVFLLGATQKQFPVPIPSTGVLTDADRELAEEAGFHLAPATTQSLAERQYLAYIAFTRPSEFLCISYPAVDEKGGAVVRSHFVADLIDLFDDLTEEPLGQDPSHLTDAQTESELAERLTASLGRDIFATAVSERPVQAGLIQAMRDDDRLAPVAASVVAALDYENRATLDRVTADRLFENPLKGSATSLGTFATCPFKYFARYVLDLKPRQEFKLEPLDLGLFYHGVLDRLHKHLASLGRNFATADDETLLTAIGEQIEAFICDNAFISKFRQHSPHNAFVIENACDVLSDCVLEIAQMSRAGTFEPVFSELSFGDDGRDSEALGKFELALPEGRSVVLKGIIDRLDVAEIDGKRVAVVFDYKRTGGTAKFDWTKFYHGLNVQLPMYLLALSETPHPGIDGVAGAFFVPIERPPDSAELDELSKKQDSFARKARGVFNGEHFLRLDKEVGSGWSKFYNFGVTKNDGQYGYYANSGVLKPGDFQNVLEFVRDKIVTLASDIVAGRIDLHPYRLANETACSHCDFKAVCRFDWQINDYRFLESTGKLAVVEGLKDR